MRLTAISLDFCCIPQCNPECIWKYFHRCIQDAVWPAQLPWSEPFANAPGVDYMLLAHGSAWNDEQAPESVRASSVGAPTVGQYRATADQPFCISMTGPTLPAS